jgi:hypothetical protein
MNSKQRRQERRKAVNNPSAHETAHPKDQQQLLLDKADKKAKGKEPDRQTTQMAHASNTYKNILGMIGQVIGYAAAILGLITGYMALIPRISVSQSQPLDVNEPFSTPFIVSNDGPLPLMNVRFACAINALRDSKGDNVTVGNQKGLGPEITVPQLISDEISPGERSTVPCANPFRFPTPLASGDVAIVVRFRIGYTFLPSKRISRFVTFKATDGHLYWYPQPVPKFAK